MFIAISELVIHSFIVKTKAVKEAKAKAANESRTASNEIYIITPNEENSQSNGKLRNENISNFIFNNVDLNKSNDNLHSEVITVSSHNNLLTLSKDTPLHSSVHSSIEHALNRIQRFSSTETKIETKKHSFDLDRFSRIWFPACYLIFNFIYWLLLLNRWFDISIFSSDNSDHTSMMKQ